MILLITFRSLLFNKTLQNIRHIIKAMNNRKTNSVGKKKLYMVKMRNQHKQNLEVIVNWLLKSSTLGIILRDKYHCAKHNSIGQTQNTK